MAELAIVAASMRDPIDFDLASRYRLGDKFICVSPSPKDGRPCNRRVQLRERFTYDHFGCDVHGYDGWWVEV